MISCEDSRTLMSSVAGFLALLAVIIGVAISKETGAIEHDVAKRSVGFVMGLMLIGVGNLRPKFRAFHSPRRDPAQTLAAERFTGWTFVITGTAYAIIWAFAPMPRAIVISSIIGLSSFALVAFELMRRVILTKTSTASRQSTPPSFDKQMLVGTMLLTLGGGFVSFLVDHVWGDEATQRVAIFFTTLITLGGASLRAYRQPQDNLGLSSHTDPEV